MVRSASLFSQLLQQIPRNEFAVLVSKHQGERHAKGFTCWAQLTAMLFSRLPAGDLQRPGLLSRQAHSPGHRPQADQVQPVLRQRPPPGRRIRGPVLGDDEPLPP